MYYSRNNFNNKVIYIGYKKKYIYLGSHCFGFIKLSKKKKKKMYTILYDGQWN